MDSNPNALHRIEFFSFFSFLSLIYLRRSRDDGLIEPIPRLNKILPRRNSVHYLVHVQKCIPEAPNILYAIQSPWCPEMPHILYATHLTAYSELSPCNMGNTCNTLLTSTVYWCIASKLKAPRNFYWMSNMFLWVEIFLFFVCYHVVHHECLNWYPGVYFQSRKICGNQVMATTSNFKFDFINEIFDLSNGMFLTVNQSVKSSFKMNCCH